MRDRIWVALLTCVFLVLFGKYIILSVRKVEYLSDKLSSKLGIFSMPFSYAMMCWLFPASGGKMTPNGIALISLVYLCLTLVIIGGLVYKRIEDTNDGAITQYEALLRMAAYAVSGVLTFALAYQTINRQIPGSFAGYLGQGLINEFVSFSYFSVVTFTTIGYGDIYPLGTWARITVMLEILFAFCYVVLVISARDVLFRPRKE